MQCREWSCKKDEADLPFQMLSPWGPTMELCLEATRFTGALWDRLSHCHSLAREGHSLASCNTMRTTNFNLVMLVGRIRKGKKGRGTAQKETDSYRRDKTCAAVSSQESTTFSWSQDEQPLEGSRWSAWGLEEEWPWCLVPELCYLGWEHRASSHADSSSSPCSATYWLCS